MNDLKAFFMDRANISAVDEIVVSNRFKDGNGNIIKFKIKTITQEENDVIVRSCERKVKNKYGQYQIETDRNLYLCKLAVACTVYPDFKNAELQENYGVPGNAEKLVKKMLTPGEYSNLVLAIQDINGYDEDINEDIEMAKN